MIAELKSVIHGTTRLKWPLASIALLPDQFGRPQSAQAANWAITQLLQTVALYGVSC
jgi:hypothetical protein